jgi:hypothetical protein
MEKELLLQAQETITSLEVVEHQMRELEEMICKQQALVEQLKKSLGYDCDFAYAEYAEFTMNKWNDLNILRKKMLIK